MRRRRRSMPRPLPIIANEMITSGAVFEPVNGSDGPPVGGEVTEVGTTARLVVVEDGPPC